MSAPDLRTHHVEAGRAVRRLDALLCGGLPMLARLAAVNPELIGKVEGWLHQR